MECEVVNNKQTTIRVDSWLAEELTAMKTGRDTLATVLARLVVASKTRSIGFDNGGDSMVVFNGQANVGDTVVAIHGSTGIYKIVDIMIDNETKSMVLEPKDKFTMGPINSRSSYHDYAILARGENHGK